MGDRNPTQTSLTVKEKAACLPCTGSSLGSDRQSSSGACPQGPQLNVALPSGGICEIRLPHLLSGVGLFPHCSLASSMQLRRWWPTIRVHTHVALTPKEREALTSSSETSRKDSDGSVAAERCDARIGPAGPVHTLPYLLPSS